MPVKGKTMKAIILLFAVFPIFAQQQVSYIATTGNVSLSGAATAATLQQPATNATMVTFPAAGATIYCSADCVATVARTCTAATATAGTVTNLVPNTPASSVTFYTASDAASCTTLQVINVTAKSTATVDLSKFNLATSGAKSNITISIASVTATVNITFYPVEQH